MGLCFLRAAAVEAGGKFQKEKAHEKVDCSHLSGLAAASVLWFDPGVGGWRGSATAVLLPGLYVFKIRPLSTVDDPQERAIHRVKSRTKSMNKRIVRILLAVLLLVAWGSTPVVADTVPLPPFCCPGCTCSK